MDLMRFDLNLLHALLALVETRSVSAAAVRVGRSQPAMSRILARLRIDFADPLLVRTGRGLMPTARALTLADELPEILLDIERAYRGASFNPSLAQHVFRGSIPDVTAATVLPNIVAAMQQEAPHCRLHIVPLTTLSASQPTVDFAISCEVHLHRGMRMEKLFDETDVLAIREDNADDVAGMDVASVMALRHVAVASQIQPEDPVDRWLREQNLSRNIVTTVPHYLQALHLVARTGLAAILPSRFCREIGAQLGVTAYDLPISIAPDRQYLFYPPNAQADPASVWLRGLIRRAVMRE